MGKKVDYTGKKFGRMTALEYSRSSSQGKSIWWFLCDCGSKVERIANNVVSGTTSSCGCYKKECLSRDKSTHGESSTQLYKVWCDIKKRCYNPACQSYLNYGGRGITFQFKDDFIGFKKCMGEVPNTEDKWTVERIDTNGNYEQGNLRWATYPEQSRNRRKQVNNTSGYTGVSLRTINGVDIAVARWVDEFGMEQSKAFSFNKYGQNAMSLAKAEREFQIHRLCELGIMYSEQHGNYVVNSG